MIDPKEKNKTSPEEKIFSDEALLPNESEDNDEQESDGSGGAFDETESVSEEDDSDDLREK